MKSARLSCRVLLTRKKKLSPTQAIKIIQKLNLTEQESLELLSDIHPELKSALNRKLEVQELTTEEFNLISNWIHFAILSLSYFKDNQSDHQWISRKLNLIAIKQWD